MKHVPPSLLRQVKRVLVAQFLVVSLLALSVRNCAAENWPQWRGSELNSNSGETSVPVKWNQNENMLWRVPMPGPAGASPVVWGDNAFVTSVDGDELLLFCIGVKSGEVKWKVQIDGANIPSHDKANSASPSPSTDGKHVWVMMGNGILACYTVEGKRCWQKDLQKVYGEFKIMFGMSTTPILDKGRLYIALMHGDHKNKSEASVGQVIALDALTGDEIWLHLRKTDGIAETTHSYASPTIYRNDTRDCLLYTSDAADE